MAQQTAVEFLFEKFFEVKWDDMPNRPIMFEQAKQMEKEQIINGWQKGYITGCVVGSNDYTNEDEEKDNGMYYYNETYGK